MFSEIYNDDIKFEMFLGMYLIFITEIQIYLK
jgi:hypothetical protein